MEDVRKVSAIVSDWVNTRSHNIPKSVIYEDSGISLFEEMSQLKRREKFAYDCAKTCSKIHINDLLKIEGEPKNNYLQFKKFLHSLIESYILKGSDTYLKNIYSAPKLTRQLIAQFRSFLASEEAVKFKKLIPISEFLFYKYCKEEHTEVFIDAFLSASLILFLFHKDTTAKHIETVNEFLQSAPESFMMIYKKTADIFNLVKSDLMIEQNVVDELIENSFIRAQRMLGKDASLRLIEETAQLIKREQYVLEADHNIRELEIEEY